MLYHGGQRPILHLQVDMASAIQWADEHNIHWTFSAQNAGTRYTDFYKSRKDLEKIDWNAVNETDFRDPLVKEGKQAEFLIHDTCPWHLVEKIGVLNDNIRNQVNGILRNVRHKPVVKIERTWYY